MRDKALQAALEIAGGVSQMARELGVTTQAVSQWTNAPVHQVLKIEKLTGVLRHELRPDVYPPDEAAA